MSPDPADVEVLSPDSEVLQTRSTYSGYLLRIVIVTLALIVVILTGLRIYQKQIKLKGKNNLNVTMMGRHYINDKQYLLKVFIEDRNILLGVSDSAINFITELEAPADDVEDEDASFGTILDLETNKATKA